MFIVDSVKSRTRSFSYGSLSAIARNVMLHLFVDRRNLCEKKESDTTQVISRAFFQKGFSDCRSTTWIDRNSWRSKTSPRPATRIGHDSETLTTLRVIGVTPFDRDNGSPLGR